MGRLVVRKKFRCQHPKTTTLYAQRREAGKRGFKPEGRKCEDCGLLLPFSPEEVRG